MLNFGTHDAGPRLLNGELNRKNRFEIKVERKNKKTLGSRRHARANLVSNDAALDVNSDIAPQDGVG